MKHVIGDFESQEKALQHHIAGMEGKGGKTMDMMAKKAKSDTEMMREKRRMMHQLIDEGMDMHEKEEMDFHEMVNDVYKSMKAMGNMKKEKSK